MRNWLNRAGYPDLHLEVPIHITHPDGSETSGILDAVAMGPGWMLILDHKTGPAPDPARRFRVLLNYDDTLVLNPAAITRWIERLRHFFPALDRFDRPDPHFDDAERTYKLEIATELKAAITQPGSDQDLADAVNSALAKSNLLQWRAYWPMSPKGDADRDKLWPALRELVDAALGAADERYEHLIAGADRIRLCARNYYIELARENGEAEVAIRAGDLGHDIGLHDRHPAICSALGSKEFQKLAEVPPPTHTLPNPSSSTVFTYKLASAEGHEPMTFEPMTAMPTATNLILHGPPGTGKTYATAWEAVRLCLGGNAAEPLRHDRDALMTEYRRLAGEGRIEFVTFHQSFSYEDFVEGLRPTTGSEQEGDDEGAGTSGGFSLKPHAGVFKIISERARLDTGDAPAKRLDRSRPIYKIALGQRGSQESRIREGLDGGLIHLGWGGDIDWSDERFDDFEEIRKAWNDQKDPGASGKDPNIEMLFAFRSGLQVGDYVVISDGRDSYRAFGRISGEYYFDAFLGCQAEGCLVQQIVEETWKPGRPEAQSVARSQNLGPTSRLGADAQRQEPGPIDIAWQPPQAPDPA